LSWGFEIKEEKMAENKLQIVHDIRQMHHTALWEEEKHFTWWVYGIVAGILYVLGNDNFSGLWKGLISLFLSVYGIFISAKGMEVFNREKIWFDAVMNDLKKNLKGNKQKEKNVLMKYCISLDNENNFSISRFFKNSLGYAKWFFIIYSIGLVFYALFHFKLCCVLFINIF
jgi:hypothetical protein